MPSWPIHAPLDAHRWQSSNVASRKLRSRCCVYNARAAFAPLKFRRRMQLGFIGLRPSGRISGSDCSTGPAKIARAATRKTGAGQIGSGETQCIRGTISWTGTQFQNSSNLPCLSLRRMKRQRNAVCT